MDKKNTGINVLGLFELMLKAENPELKRLLRKYPIEDLVDMYKLFKTALEVDLCDPVFKRRFLNEEV